MAQAEVKGENDVTRRWSILTRIQTWLADWQLVLVVVLAPVFMLADRLSNTVVALAVLAVLPVWWIYRLARGRFFSSTPVDIPILILLATLPVGYWAAALPELSIPYLIQYLIAVTLFYALVNSLAAPAGGRRVELVGWLMLAGTALLTGLALVGTAWGNSKFLPVNPGSYIPYLVGALWYSEGFHVNIVGGALAVLVPVTAAYAVGRSMRWWQRWLLGMLFVGESVALVLTQSRGALLGFAAALLVVAIARDRRWTWAVLFLVVVAAVGILVYGVQPTLELIMGGVGDSAVQSAEGRLELFSRGLYMLQDFSFTGVGLGMFPRVLPILYPLFLVGPDTQMPHVHNIYLQAGIDHGFPGLIAFLAILVLLLVMGIETIRLSRGRRWEPLAIGLLGGLVAYLVHGFFDSIWHTPRSHIIIWGFFGVLTAVWRFARTQEAASSSVQPQSPDGSDE